MTRVITREMAAVLHWAHAMAFAESTLPNYEKQVLAVLDREVRKALRKAMSAALRKRMNWSDHAALSKALPELAGLPLPKRSQIEKTVLFDAATEAAWSVLESLDSQVARGVAEQVCRKLHPEASLLDMQCRMPPVAKEPAKRKPKALTLVERRAKEINQKLRNWKRKQSLAKTKVAALRKKAAYYKKKGAV